MDHTTVAGVFSR